MSNFDDGDTSTGAGAGGAGGGMQPPNNGTPVGGAVGAKEYNSKGLMFQRLSLRDSKQVNNMNHHHDHHQH